MAVNSKWKRGEAEASPKYFDKLHPPPHFYVPACMSCCKWLNLLGVSKYKISNMTCIFTCKTDFAHIYFSKHFRNDCTVVIFTNPVLSKSIYIFH